MEGENQNKTMLEPEQQISRNSSSSSCSSPHPCYCQADQASTHANPALDYIKVRPGSRGWPPTEWGRPTSSFGVNSGGQKEHSQVETAGRARKFQWPPTWGKHSPYSFIYVQVWLLKRLPEQRDKIKMFKDFLFLFREKNKPSTNI